MYLIGQRAPCLKAQMILKLIKEWIIFNIIASGVIFITTNEEWSFYTMVFEFFFYYGY